MSDLTMRAILLALRERVMKDIAFRLKLTGALLAFSAINVASGYYHGRKSCGERTAYAAASSIESHPNGKQIKADNCLKARRRST